MLAAAALHEVLFLFGFLGLGLCRTLFGIPFYLVYLPLCSLLVCLLALRLRLRFSLVYLAASFLLSGYGEVEKYEFIMDWPLVHFGEVVARFGDIAAGGACSILVEPFQFWATSAYAYGAASFGFLMCAVYRFWPRRAT